MHSDVSSTIYSEFTMETDNNHVFQPLSLFEAIILLYTFFLSKAKKKENLNP